MTEVPEAALELLTERPTYAVATSGEHPWVATMYFVRRPDGHLYTAIKSDSISLAALEKCTEVAFAINGGNPDVFLQGLGEAEDLGWFSDHPEVREALIEKSPEIQKFLDNVPKLRVLKIEMTELFVTDHRQKISPRVRF